MPVDGCISHCHVTPVTIPANRKREDKQCAEEGFTLDLLIQQ